MELLERKCKDDSPPGVTGFAGDSPALRSSLSGIVARKGIAGCPQLLELGWDDDQNTGLLDRVREATDELAGWFCKNE
jgi:hypothetical protein